MYYYWRVYCVLVFHFVYRPVNTTCIIIGVSTVSQCFTLSTDLQTQHVLLLACLLCPSVSLCLPTCRHNMYYYWRVYCVLVFHFVYRPVNTTCIIIGVSTVSQCFTSSTDLQTKHVLLLVCLLCPSVPLRLPTCKHNMYYYWRVYCVPVFHFVYRPANTTCIIIGVSTVSQCFTSSTDLQTQHVLLLACLLCPSVSLCLPTCRHNMYYYWRVYCVPVFHLLYRPADTTCIIIGVSTVSQCFTSSTDLQTQHVLLLACLLCPSVSLRLPTCKHNMYYYWCVYCVPVFHFVYRPADKTCIIIGVSTVSQCSTSSTDLQTQHVLLLACLLCPSVSLRLPTCKHNMYYYWRVYCVPVFHFVYRPVNTTCIIIGVSTVSQCFTLSTDLQTQHVLLLACLLCPSVSLRLPTCKHNKYYYWRVYCVPVFHFVYRPANTTCIIIGGSTVSQCFTSSTELQTQHVLLLACLLCPSVSLRLPTCKHNMYYY